MTGWAAGIDESGRGALLGPLVVVGVAHRPGYSLGDVADSKALTGPRRTTIAERLQADDQIHVAVVVFDVATLDRDGTDVCNQAGIADAAHQLAIRIGGNVPLPVVVDGVRAPASPAGTTLTCQPKADRDVPSVAAASIVAKHTRDTITAQLLAELDPEGRYDPSGYPTPSHLAALHRHGPVAGLHRAQVAPVRTPRLFV